jgi:hypothetical protein
MKSVAGNAIGLISNLTNSVVRIKPHRSARELGTNGVTVMIAQGFTLVCGKEYAPSTYQLIVNEIELEFSAAGLFTTKVAVPLAAASTN